MSARRSDALTKRQSLLVERGIAMYRQGWFPMFEPEGTDGPDSHEGSAPSTPGTLQWVQPHERWVIPLGDEFHVPASLAQRVRSRRFTITTDREFERVLRACGEPKPGRESTWLCEEIVELFTLFHKAGLAHSIEAWAGDALVGGLYGVAIGSVFCGESMFSKPRDGGTDASKVCLVRLVRHLRDRGFTLLDAQLENPHLTQFGMKPMDAESYLAHLGKHADERIAWQPFA